MKKVLLIIIGSLLNLLVVACPVCERQQPRILRGIIHGTGPDSKMDYLIVSAMIAIVIFTLFFSVKWMIKPGERSGDHIKRFILNNE